ncbi:hypothetical protein KGQ20_13295 [Catenulispora sp. NF23]|uniref:ABC transporter n=1 Tax=Catenulispora pinistramenti TaxID=2705254 RepID=A0ABS5KNU8_9ACTN|nr:hypothetical protein [Catenulispora pinistramenti]MBS2533748.1 hypothetical protein [Catenulispora pinistramenti]MBS2547729.1 hypothetical protein [Catenulispora pinistramenti]
MKALYRYTLSTALHSQRYVAPMVFFLALLAVLTSSDSGPLLGVYAAAAVSVLACATWLTAAVVNIEEPVGRTIVVVNAGNARGPLAAAVAVSATFCVGMVVIGLGYPVISGSHTVLVRSVLLGAAAELTCAAVGIGLGLLCSRLVIGRPGASVLVGLALVLGVILAKPLPPVYPMLHAMTGGHPSAGVGFVGYAAAGLLFLAAAGAATQYIAVRLD